MFDHMLARSFSKNEQKRFGNCIFVICIFFAFSLSTLFKPSFPLSILNLEVSTISGINLLEPSASQVHMQGSRNDTSVTPEPLGTPAHIPQPRSRNDGFKGRRELSHWIDCNFSEAISDHCEIKGMIIIDGQSSTIFTTSLSTNKSWIIRPYARKESHAMKSVRKWTIKPVELQKNTPVCTKNHTHSALLFSMGGFSGNHFHDFSDIVIPLFTNSQFFKQKVHLLVTDYKQWWASKFQRLLTQLSNHQVVDIDRTNETHCYENTIIGLRSYKELGIDTSRSPNGYSMKDFRDFLRSAYSLERQRAIKLKVGNKKRSRLMIISRKTTRKLTNEADIAKMAEKVGYEVVIGDVTLSTNLSSFAQVVNSCDVLMGVHGAGLTNMVFLPDNAVVVQVVPFGGIEGIAKTAFGDPSKEMNLRYLKYSIRVKESSLRTQYRGDDVVLRDPMFVHRQGWDAIRSTYLDKQNVRLDVHRFRSTLLKALEILHH